MVERKPRKRWGNRDKEGRIYTYRTKQEAVAMSDYHCGTDDRRELVYSEYTGPDLGWSDWEPVNS